MVYCLAGLTEPVNSIEATAEEGDRDEEEGVGEAEGVNLVVQERLVQLTVRRLRG